MPREYTAEEEAFLNQNGWAAQADALLQQTREGDPAWEAFAGAVMGLVFEQFKNTHWVEAAIRDHAPGNEDPMNQDIERQREEIRRENAHADQIAMQKGEGRNVVSDAAIRARDQAPKPTLRQLKEEDRLAAYGVVDCEACGSEMTVGNMYGMGTCEQCGFDRNPMGDNFRASVVEHQRRRDLPPVPVTARDQAAELAALPVDERVEIGRLARERDEERQRAASRAPRRLRLNVTEAQGYGYVGCSLFQSDNGVNWGAIATTVVIPEQWFADVFGKAEVGRRIEFDITNIHDVRED